MPSQEDLSVVVKKTKPAKKRSVQSKTKSLSSIEKEIKLAKDIEPIRTISQESQLKFLDQLRSMPLRSIKRKEALAAAITIPQGGRQAGYRSKSGNGKLVRRGLRSFQGERERQLLKQLSTQLFFALQKHIKCNEASEKLIEVQMMHLSYGAKDFVFVCANEVDTTQYFESVIGENLDTLRAALTTVYKPTRSNEGKIRSKRYANKLKHRVFAENPVLPGSENFKDTIEVASLMDTITKPWKTVDLNSRFKKKIEKIAEEETGGVFMMDIHRRLEKTRHAEEWLVDVKDIFDELSKRHSLTVRAAISGKKRPCGTCAGRMKGKIDNYNLRFGLLWLSAAGRQPADVFKSTLHEVTTNPSHITEDGRGLQAPDYDSGSDSEYENRRVNRNAHRVQRS